MKFEVGDAVDSDHCTALTHEIFRCHDEFLRFTHYANIMIMKGRTREVSYRAYNAYSSFVHHLYEFILGCNARDSGNTKITNKKGEERTLIIDSYIMHHAQPVGWAGAGSPTTHCNGRETMEYTDVHVCYPDWFRSVVHKAKQLHPLQPDPNRAGRGVR